MPLLSKHQDPTELGDRLRDADAVTAEFLSEIISKTCRRFPSQGQSGKTARVERPPADISKKLGLSSRARCLVVRVLATSRHREPITFQKIVVPPVEYELELTAAPYEVAKALAA